MVEANVKIIEELHSFLELVSQDPDIRSLFTCNPAAFSRNRKLPLQLLVGLLINMPKRSLSIELREFFEELGAGAPACTKGAFCLQRVKLKPLFFKVWNKWLTDHFYRYYGQSVRRWHGWRLLAVDGSRCYLGKHPQVIDYFGTQVNQHVQIPMGQLLQVHDVLNNLIIEGDIYPFHSSERALAARIADCLPDDSLTLFDRGYPGYWLMYLLQHQERPRHFIMRCKLDFNAEVQSFCRSRKCSRTATFFPTHKAILQLRQCGFIVTACTALKVRMVKVKLPTGQTEILLTNLYDEKIYSFGMIKEAYGLRWAIETLYGRQKNQLQMEIFSGHKVICIQQDYAAALLVANLQSLLEKQSAVFIQLISEARRYEYKINTNNSWAALKHRIIKLFLRNNILSVLLELQRLFEQHIEPVRPDRQYPRNKKAHREHGKYMAFSNYKRAI